MSATNDDQYDDWTTDDGTTSTAREIKAARRAQRQAERAARAQRKADAARQRAVEAARAGGLFEGMEAAPPAGGSADPSASGRPDETTTDDTPGTATDTVEGAYAAAPAREPEKAGRAGWSGFVTSIEPVRRTRLTTAFAVAAVVLVVVAGLATWGYVDARQETSAEQTIADAPASATDAAREIATQMFTYDHRTVDNDLAAVRERLTDPALTEFVEQSMPAVASNAKENEASVYATVAAAAPEEVTDGEHVSVLVMLNRMVSTRESPEAAASASRLRLNMVNEDGVWKLGELNSL